MGQKEIDFWDKKATKDNTTGYTDPTLKYFDQLIRLRTIDFVLSKYIKKNQKEVFLDFGCGSGDFCGFFSHRFKKIFGYDPSCKILEVAKIYNQYDNVEYLNDLALCGSKVNFAISITVLQHIINDDLLVIELLKIGKLCENGAIFVALESTKIDGLEIEQPHYVNARSKVGWLKLFYKAGFQEIEILDFYNPGYFKNFLYKKYEKRIKLHQFCKKVLKKFNIEYPSIVFKKAAQNTLAKYPNENGLLSASDSISKIFVLRKNHVD